MSSLYRSKLVDKPQRGIYQISPNAENIVDISNSSKIKEYIKNKEKITKSNLEEDKDTDLTPQEKLYKSYVLLKKSICNEILDTILRKSPQEFEKLVVQLYKKWVTEKKLKILDR